MKTFRPMICVASCEVTCRVNQERTFHLYQRNINLLKYKLDFPAAPRRLGVSFSRRGFISNLLWMNAAAEEHAALVTTGGNCARFEELFHCLSYLEVINLGR